MIKVLFITHEVSRTGAPLVLYNIVKWIRDSASGISPEILSLKDGPFSQDFSRMGAPYFLLPKGNPQMGFRRYFRRDVRGGLIKRLQKVPYDIIYANSVVSLRHAVLIQEKSNAKIICHVHELPTVITVLNIDTTLFKQVDRFIAVSNIVRDELIHRYNVEASRISVVYENIDVTLTKQNAERNQELPEEQISGKRLVLSVGNVHWRKGYEYFIEVARQVLEQYEKDDLIFVWVGHVSSMLKTIIEVDVLKMGLKDRIIFLGERVNPYPIFRQSEIFLLPSKEDPFPLVCLEAGLFGLPIVCFDKAGGIPELLEGGGGVVVPYGNVSKMADSVLELLQNRRRQKQLGELLSATVTQYDVKWIAPGIVRILEQVHNGEAYEESTEKS